MMLKLSLKNVSRNKRRTAITIAVIGVGSSMLILSLAYVEFIKWGLRERTIHGDTGHFQIVYGDTHKIEEENTLKYGIENWECLVEKLEEFDEIELAAPEIDFSGLASNGDKSQGIFVSAVMPGKRMTLSSGFTDAEPYQKLLDRGEDGIILGEGLAKYLNVKAGDDITIMTTTVDGALNAMDYVMVGTVSTFSSEMSKRFAIICLMGAQSLLATQKVEKVLVGLYDTKDLSISAEKAAKVIGQDLRIIFWDEISPYYGSVMQFFNQLIAFLAPILMIVVWFSTMNTVLMSVLERSSELATLRAMGTPKLTLIRMLIMEGVWLGVIGVLLGFLLEIFLANAINHMHIMLPPPPGQSNPMPLLVRNVSSNFVFVGVLTLIVTAFSTIFPALRILKLNIVDALRR